MQSISKEDDDSVSYERQTDSEAEWPSLTAKEDFIIPEAKNTAQVVQEVKSAIKYKVPSRATTGRVLKKVTSIVLTGVKMKQMIKKGKTKKVVRFDVENDILSTKSNTP